MQVGNKWRAKYRKVARGVLRIGRGNKEREGM